MLMQALRKFRANLKSNQPMKWLVIGKNTMMKQIPNQPRVVEVTRLGVDTEARSIKNGIQDKAT